jgi:hypothetical protein
MAHLKTTSFIDIVTPIAFAQTALALVKTCMIERNFKNLRYYAVNDNQLFIPHYKMNAITLISNNQVTTGKCLITGGLGGIGHKLMEKLECKKVVVGRTSRELVDSKMPKDVIYYECDVSELSQIERVFRTEPQINTVFHLASVVHNGLLKVDLITFPLKLFRT